MISPLPRRILRPLPMRWRTCTSSSWRELRRWISCWDVNDVTITMTLVVSCANNPQSSLRRWRIPTCIFLERSRSMLARLRSRVIILSLSAILLSYLYWMKERWRFINRWKGLRSESFNLVVLILLYTSWHCRVLEPSQEEDIWTGSSVFVFTLRVCGQDEGSCHSIKYRDARCVGSQVHWLEEDWLQSPYAYAGSKEEIPKDIPHALGKPVLLLTYGDANLCHDLLSGVWDWEGGYWYWPLAFYILSTRHHLTLTGTNRTLLKLQLTMLRALLLLEGLP